MDDPQLLVLRQGQLRYPDEYIFPSKIIEGVHFVAGFESDSETEIKRIELFCRSNFSSYLTSQANSILTGQNNAVTAEVNLADADGHHVEKLRDWILRCLK